MHRCCLASRCERTLPTLGNLGVKAIADFCRFAGGDLSVIQVIESDCSCTDRCSDWIGSQSRGLNLADHFEAVWVYAILHRFCPSDLIRSTGEVHEPSGAGEHCRIDEVRLRPQWYSSSGPGSCPTTLPTFVTVEQQALADCAADQTGSGGDNDRAHLVDDIPSSMGSA